MIGGQKIAEAIVPRAFGPLREACTPQTAHPFVIRTPDPDRPPIAGHCETITAGLVKCAENDLGIHLPLVLGRLVTHTAFIDDMGEPQVNTVELINTHIWAQYSPPGIEIPEVYLYDMAPDQATVGPEARLEAVHLPAPICGTYDMLARHGVIDVVTGRRIRLDYQPRLFFPDIPALVHHCDQFEGNDLRKRLPMFFENLAVARRTLGCLTAR